MNTNMKWTDIFLYCMKNIKKRKLRTFLTIFGVMTGIASVIAFLSVAIGYRVYMMKEFSGENAATVITVSAKKSGNIAPEDRDKLLTESRVEEIAALSHVASVSPEIRFQANFTYGKYTGAMNLIGIERSRLEKIPLREGGFPKDSAAALQMIIGARVKYSMYYTEGNRVYDYTTTGEVPDIDLRRELNEVSILDETAMTALIPQEEETEQENGEEEYVRSATLKQQGEGEQEAPEAEYRGYNPGFAEDDAGSEDDSDEAGMETFGYARMSVKVSGIIAGGSQSSGTYSDEALTDIALLQEYLMNKYGRGNIPGQPKVNGVPVREWAYTSVRVQADHVESVPVLKKRLKKMGFKTENNKELYDTARRNIRMAQAVFAGIGLIALFVATIGIANTMFMAIQERQKNIGIIKVLGGRAHDILRIYLCEAAILGLSGGILGALLSLLISAAVNYIAVHRMGFEGAISVLSAGLLLLSVLFSTAIGVVSGYFPARKAMKITVLEAVSTE